MTAGRVPQSDRSEANPVPETPVPVAVRAYPQRRRFHRGVLPAAGRFLQSCAAAHRYPRASAACADGRAVALLLHGPRDSGGQSPAELRTGKQEDHGAAQTDVNTETAVGKGGQHQ